jgi:hypothetical protein
LISRGNLVRGILTGLALQVAAAAMIGGFFLALNNQLAHADRVNQERNAHVSHYHHV